MKPPITAEWIFNATQTDFAIVTPASNQILTVTYAKCICANSNAADVSVRIGFTSTTLPAATPNQAAGNSGLFVSHGGIAKGGGEVSQMAGQPIAISSQGQAIKLTCSAPTGGDLRVILQYRLDDQ